jgi:HK97 family phage prohead protease
MKIKGINSGFSDADTKQGVVSGYFAMFNNKDLDGDVIEKGSFTKTVQERGPNGKQLIKYLLDHKKDQVVAKITELYEDEKGLRYTAKIGSHSLGQDFLKMVESELINQHSVGYRIIQSKYDQVYKSNRIKEMAMFEGSAIQFLGANNDTTFIELKEITDALDMVLKLEKFVSNTDATDQTIIQLEEKIKSLYDNIRAVTNTPMEVKADLTDTIINLINKTKNNGI